jgi:lysozyme
MTASQELIDFLKQHEGFRSAPYLDTEGVPTIGYGTVYYPNGTKVTMADAHVDEPTAAEYLTDTVNKNAATVEKIVCVPLTQGRLDALTEFSYNLGLGALESSTLLKMIHANINDPTISEQFGRWVNGAHGVIQALVERRAWDKAKWDEVNQTA